VKVVLDTNVFVSGVFFRGPPYRVLKAWRDGKIQILVSPAILEEYHRVMLELSARFPEIDPRSLVDFLAVHSESVLPPSLPPVIQHDPSDDKFLECALAGKAACIISGDKHLLNLSQFKGIPILKPYDFVHRYLRG
jgi:putative PIN family toxin of toxin-antitoxin system